MGETAGREPDTVIRTAEYIGSFPVDDSCLDEQIQQLHTQLKSLKSYKSKQTVSLRFSVKGVKIYDEDEMTLLMAHAMCRVSLSTARPSDAQFAFVSHNPGNSDPQLYCHLFRARHARAAQFLNMVLCRCFQLYFRKKHPEEAQKECSEKKLSRAPSLLNQGFPLSVNALVSFRRAPTQGLLPGAKVVTQSSLDQVSSPEDGPTCSPTIVRKMAIRTKELRSGAYRSFTFTPLKQRNLQDKLSAPQEKAKVTAKVCDSRIPSLAETEEALAQAVWCWDGVSNDCSTSLLEDDVLGAFLLCPHPIKPNQGSLILRSPLGLLTHPIKNSNGRFRLEKCKSDFESLAALIEHYREFREELQCSLSCARVNHCYNWEEIENNSARSLIDSKKSAFNNKSWV